MADELKEGISCMLVNCGVLSELSVIPLYRLYNVEYDDHLYTTSDNERLSCVKNGWQYEGVAALLPANQNGASGNPLYRLCHPQGWPHFYTTNLGEHDNLIRAGWRDEGLYFGASKLPASNQVITFGSRSDNVPNEKGFTRTIWGDSYEAQYLRSLGWGEASKWITAKRYLAADVQWNGDLGSQLIAYPGNNTDAQIFILRKDGTHWMFQKRIGNQGYITRGPLKNHYNEIFLKPKHWDGHWNITPTGQTVRFMNHSYPSYYIHTGDIRNTNNYFLEVMDKGNGIPTAGAILTACRSSVARPTASDHKWMIIPTVVNSGVYSIHPLVNDERLTHRLDIEGPGVSNVKIWSASNSQGQLWVPIRVGNDMYAIRNLSNGGYLDVPGDTPSVRSGANVQVYPNYDGKSEAWHLVGFGHTDVNGVDAEVYRIGMLGTSKEYALDVSGGNTEVGANVQVWEMNGSPAQLFAFVPHDVNDPTVPVPSSIGLSRVYKQFANQKFQRLPFENETGVLHAFPCWVCTDAWFGDVGGAGNSQNENGYEVQYRRRYYNNSKNKWDNWGNWTNWDAGEYIKSGNNAMSDTPTYTPYYDRKKYRNQETQFRVRCIGATGDYTQHVHGAYGEGTLNFIAAPFYTFGTQEVGDTISCDGTSTEYTLEDVLKELLLFDMYTLVDDLPVKQYDIMPKYTINEKQLIFENQTDVFIGDGTTSIFETSFEILDIVDITYGSVSDSFDSAETATGYSYTLSRTATEIESVIVNSVDTIASEVYSLSGNQLTMSAWPIEESWLLLHGEMVHPTETSPIQNNVYFIEDADGEYSNSTTGKQYSKVEDPIADDMSTYYVLNSGTSISGQSIWVVLSQPVANQIYDVRLNDDVLVENEDYEVVYIDNQYILTVVSTYSYQKLSIKYYTDDCQTTDTALSVSYLTDYDPTYVVDSEDRKKITFTPAVPSDMNVTVEYSFAPPEGTIIDIRYVTSDDPQAVITLDGLGIPYSNDLDGSSNLYITEMSITKDGTEHKVLNLEQPFTGLGRNGIVSVKFNDFINYLDGESVTFKYQVGNDQHARWTDLTQTATLGLDTSGGTLDIWPGTGPMVEQGPRHTGVIFMPKDTNLRCGMAYKSKVFELPRWEEFDKTVDGVEYSAFALPYSFRDESTRVIGQRSNSNGEFGIESAEIDLRIFDQEKVHSWITTDGDIVCIDCREGDYLQSDRSMQKNNTALDLSGREHQTVIFGDTNQSSFTVEGSIIYSEDYRNTDSTLEDIDSLLGTHTIYRDPYGHVVYAAVTDVSYQTHHDYATVSISMIEETR